MLIPTLVTLCNTPPFREGRQRLRAALRRWSFA